MKHSTRIVNFVDSMHFEMKQIYIRNLRFFFLFQNPVQRLY